MKRICFLGKKKKLLIFPPHSSGEEMGWKKCGGGFFFEKFNSWGVGGFIGLICGGGGGEGVVGWCQGNTILSLLPICF